MEPAATRPGVEITDNGPYHVTGHLPLGRTTIGVDADGNSVEWVAGDEYPSEGEYWLCRCGHSGSKPFCDGTHAKIGFDGTETASREPYLQQAKALKGPGYTLTDAPALCASARFCDPNGTVWKQIHQADDPQVRENLVRQTCDCPSGRLVLWDNASGKALEPGFEPSVVSIADPAEDCLGPLWVRGGVQVKAADGFNYEVRNRMTLCRCGASNNKPFCDGMHMKIRFNADT